MGVAFATFFKLLQPFIKTPESGAQTSIFCAVDESVANESGLYYADCKVKLLFIKYFNGHISQSDIQCYLVIDNLKK